jgi:mannose-6-phosphate isomerase-like protein (cupin superfamily)
MIDIIKHKKEIIAIIIGAEFKKEGVEFFTPDDFSQQIAYMNHPADYKISPHVHNKISRKVHYTLETLFIRSGRLRVDFYTREKIFLESRELKTGDVILLASGGHGFKMLEPTEIIEVKQGPYSGENDKIRFKGINDEE